MGQALRRRHAAALRLAQGQIWPLLADLPSVLGKRLQDTDPAKAQRVVQAMMGMVKIDIAGIERAYAG